MKFPHAWHTATLLPDGRVLIAGGLVNDRLDGVATNAAEVFDPRTSRWTATGHMTRARFHHTATLLQDGTVLVVGGYAGGSGGPALKSAELYDPGSGKWTATHDLARARADHTATRLASGMVLVVGGGGEDSIGDPGPMSRSAEVYDPVTGTWRTADPMTETRIGFTATLLRDGTVLVVGGGPGSAAAERYDPSSGSWTATGPMAEGRWWHSATLLADGTVLVAGGCLCSADPDERSAHTELYDPGSDSWRSTASMTSPRIGALSAGLPDRTVLVVNGSIARGDNPSAEVFDMATGGWRVTAHPARARVGAAMTVLDDGRALLTGDYDELDKGSAELFDPGTPPN